MATTRVVKSNRPSSSNATITAMTTVSFDASIANLTKLPLLDEPWSEIEGFQAARCAQVSGRRVYVFRCGAAVFEGTAEDLSVLGARLEAATGRRLLPETSETMLIARADNDRRAITVKGDMLLLGEDTEGTRAAVALMLGQSAALERYEKRSERLLDEALELVQPLVLEGRSRIGGRALSRRLLGISAARLELARDFFLIDKPEQAWEDKNVDKVYYGLLNELELEDRHKAMLHKLETLQTTLQTLQDSLHIHHSLGLEWAIVILIVFEIVLALVRPH